MVGNLGRLLKSGAIASLAWFGGLWLLLEPLGAFGLSATLSTFGIDGYISLALISIVLGLLTTLLRAFVARQDPNKLTVFSTPNQRSELRATRNGLELFLFDHKNKSKHGLKWVLTPNQLREILDKDDIFVRNSAQSERGLFDIGPRTEWYYSRQLFSEPKQMYEAIRNIIDRALKLSKKK